MFDILVENRFTVDSSIFPISGHDRYGAPNAKKEIHELLTASGKITEFPPSAWHIKKLNLPIGGGYFRIFPWAISKRAIHEVRKSSRPAMFYVHPWEVDPDQPRIRGTGWKSQFRHYTGLRSTHSRLEKMLKTVSFASMSQVIQASEMINPRAGYKVLSGGGNENPTTENWCPSRY